MATQGVVSVIADGKMIMKIVAGCDGYNAERVAEYIKAQYINNEGIAYSQANHILSMCSYLDFGCKECLVLLTPKSIHTENWEDVGSWIDRYRETFDDPNFNPRWHYGTADYVEIVEWKDSK